MKENPKVILLSLLNIRLGLLVKRKSEFLFVRSLPYLRTLLLEPSIRTSKRTSDEDLEREP